MHELEVNEDEALLIVVKQRCAGIVQRGVFSLARLWWILHFELRPLCTVVSKLSHRKILRFVTNEMT